MKIDFFIEVGGKQVDYNSLVDIAKETWRAEGNKIKDLSSLNLYYKPEDGKCYYVINDATRGFFEI